MRTVPLLLTLSLAATFLAFTAPAADACTGFSCVPGCTQDRCPPGCGDNVPCCQPGEPVVDCLVPTCTPTFCVETPCASLGCVTAPDPICYGQVCITFCTYLLGCPINPWCNNLYCYMPPPFTPLA